MGNAILEVVHVWQTLRSSSDRCFPGALLVQQVDSNININTARGMTRGE